MTTGLLLGIMQLARSSSGSNAVEVVIAPFFSAYEWARSKMPGEHGHK